MATSIEVLVARLRATPAAVRAGIPEMAAAIKAEIYENIAAERGPDGTPWPPSKDGRPVLVNAGAKLTDSVSGSTIVITLTGIEARHHFGSVKGGKVRQILPRTLPSMKRAQARMRRIVAKRAKAALAGKAAT